MAKEGDLLSIRRPSRQIGQHRWENKLELLGSVDLASPHGAIGGIVVGDPLSVTREVEPHRRNSREVRARVVLIWRRSATIPRGAASPGQRVSCHRGWDGIANIHWASRQLNRLLAWFERKRPPMFVDGPEVRRPVAYGLEDEILSVRRPFAAAFVGRAVPPRKQGTKIAAVRGSLPDGTVVGLGIVHRKTQNRAVGRPADIAGGSSRQQEPVQFAAIAVCHEYLVPFAVSDPLSVRRPRTGVALEDRPIDGANRQARGRSKAGRREKSLGQYSSKAREPSGEISKTLEKPVSSSEVGMGNVSPPVTEVWERRDWPSMK